MKLPYFGDYHVHSSISPDSEATMEACCERALALGMKEITFTDHYEFYHQPLQQPRFGHRYLEQYVGQVQECQRHYEGQLKILLGIEMGQMNLSLEEAQRLIQAYPFDYVIGSLHKIDDVDLSDWQYNRTGIERLTKNYYRYLEQLAYQSDYDCLGHLNLVRRYGYRAGVMESDQPYQDDIMRILKIVIDRGKGIEINTSGLRQGLGEPLPSTQILEWYRELGGTILTIGSDAHRAGDVGAGFENVCRMLVLLGFTEIVSYRRRVATKCLLA